MHCTTNIRSPTPKIQCYCHFQEKCSFMGCLVHGHTKGQTSKTLQTCKSTHFLLNSPHSFNSTLIFNFVISQNTFSKPLFLQTLHKNPIIPHTNCQMPHTSVKMYSKYHNFSVTSSTLVVIHDITFMCI